MDMASDSQERRAIEEVTRRIKDQDEKDGRKRTYDQQRNQAIEIARDFDKRREGR
jgi:F0F1-type ATP synthase assembly protein I